MASAKELYASNFTIETLKGQDPKVLTIKGVTEEVFKDQKTNKEKVKLRLAFLEDRRGLVLNTGNCNFLIALAGDDYSKWVGTKIEVFYDPTARGMAGAFGGVAVRKPSN